MDGPEGAKTLPWERRVRHAMSLILNFLKEGRVVLLHCKAGKHRSGFVGAVTLAVLRNLTWDQARDILFETRGFYTCFDKQIIAQMGHDLDTQGFIQDFRGTLRFAAPKVFANLEGFPFCTCFPVFRLDDSPGTQESGGAGAAGTLVSPTRQNPRGSSN